MQKIERLQQRSELACSCMPLAERGANGRGGPGPVHLGPVSSALWSNHGRTVETVNDPSGEELDKAFVEEPGYVQPESSRFQIGRRGKLLCL